MQAAIWVFSFFFPPLWTLWILPLKLLTLGNSESQNQKHWEIQYLYTLLSFKSLFISPLKLGTCSVCCPWQLLQSAYVWQMAESAEVWLSDQLLGDVSHWAEVAPVFVFISSACCTTDFSLLLVQAPPLGCPVPQQNQQGMLLNFTGAVDTSRVLRDWRSEIWNPEVVHSRSCLQDVSFQHWYASLQ